MSVGADRESKTITNRHVVPALIMIMAVTFAVHSPALWNEFVNWDDDVYVYENPHVQTMSVGSMMWIFTHAYFNSYIPLTLVSHAIDYQLWHLNPWGHHFTSLVIHSINTGWVFLLAWCC